MMHLQDGQWDAAVSPTLVHVELSPDGGRASAHMFRPPQLHVLGGVRECRAHGNGSSKKASHGQGRVGWTGRLSDVAVPVPNPGPASTWSVAPHVSPAHCCCGLILPPTVLDLFILFGVSWKYLTNEKHCRSRSNEKRGDRC